VTTLEHFHYLTLCTVSTDLVNFHFSCSHNVPRKLWSDSGGGEKGADERQDNTQ
jgi:hypothetical protein